MKFKALLTPDGVHLLEKRFVPALEKVGKVCHLYLTRDHATFVHALPPSSSSSDGLQCATQIQREVLFSEYRISSQCSDRIAFALDLALLLRALRSALSILSQSNGGHNSNTDHGRRDLLHVQIKLVKKLPVGSHQPSPFLSFETKGYKSAVIHDVPISKPLSKADITELQTVLDAAQDLPQTLVQVPDLIQLQNLVDRLKNVGDLLNVSVTQYGDFHLQVSTSLITVGSELRRLRVLGVRADAPAMDQNLTAASRTEMALRRGEAQSVQVSLKHLAKSLQCQVAKPDCAFYGIAPMNACLTMIFQFFIPGTRQTDKSISFYCRLPVLDTGSN